ncbi:MAG: hypothetical protein ACJA0V_001240 [Planctomycetota bacterium]
MSNHHRSDLAADFVTALRSTFCCLLAISLASCYSTARQPLGDLDYPGTLQAPARLPVEAVWQQHVTAAWQAPGQERQERGFDAALQRSGDTLTVIGLSPMGSVGFSIQQSAAGINVVNNMPEQMVIPPRFILLDVQRAFFPCSDATLQDGERSQQQNDELVTETWRAGKLTKRTFARLDHQPKGTITISYEWGKPGWTLPTRTILNNGWFGYELTIVTHSETRIGATAGKPAPEESAGGDSPR